MDIQFAGEHLLPGKLGQFFIILTFGSALISAISYYFATVKDTNDDSWKRIARLSAWVNTFAVVGIGASLFYIIYSHYFEYNYAWAHSSRSLPVYYIISSFWEGQEGSFWLWMFWQAVLTNVLIQRARTWETPVLTIIMLSQVFISSMLLGVEVLGLRIGSSPFILLRDAVEGPIFSRADYLNLIPDGNGLNPLLQNYWMVIHPPTLFLGFASMVVPFAYAVAGLWQKRYKEWVTAALPWALFAVMVLGTGIIMGSFWAYEALNFGGFWAWDPVENASIIPWLTLIAAVHVMIAYKNSGHSYFTATFLVLISFVLVLYASFLTRSGILGETSVHSFTDLGMFGHLLTYLLVFFVIAIGFLIARWKDLPITKKDEETYSREFWLFIGALVLTVSCIQVIATTSIPVFNAIFGTKIAPPANVFQHYHQWQVPFAIVISLVSGFSQYLKYKNTDPRKLYVKLVMIIIMAAMITSAFAYVADVYHNVMYVILTFAAVFSLCCNVPFLIDALKGKWKLAGASIAHIGFAFLLLGALVAAATSKVVSINTSGVGFGEEFDKSNNAKENIILYENEPVRMDQYTVTYKGDSTVGVNTYYKINYKTINQTTRKVIEEFDLYPNAQQNAKMQTIVASPDTRHYLLHDIYTHVSSVPLKTETAEHDDHTGHSADEGYDQPATYEVALGDTIRYREGIIVVKGINRNATVEKIPLGKNDVAIALTLQVIAKNKTYEVDPIFLLKAGNKFDFGKAVADAGLKFRFTNVLPDKNKLEVMVYQKPLAEKKWVVLKAIKFPFINFFWAGNILMMVGFLLSIFRRNKEIRVKPEEIKEIKLQSK